MYDFQLFKGNTTNKTTYTASPEERALLNQQLQVQEEFFPQIVRLNKDAGNLLWDTIGDFPIDYNAMNNEAQNQIGNAQGLINDLNNGQLNPAYQQAMENSIRSGVNSTVGDLINNLGQRGIVNSSVVNKGLGDIESRAANAMAQQYQNNLSTASELAQQQIDDATAKITTGAAAQEAAQAPALSLWNASLGLTNSGNNVLGSIAGRYGTTTSKQSSGGGNFGSGLMGLATGIGSSNGFWNMIGGNK